MIRTLKNISPIFNSESEYASGFRDHGLYSSTESASSSSRFNKLKIMDEQVFLFELRNCTVATFLVEELLKHLKANNIIIPNLSEIHKYLLDNMDMIDFLKSVCMATLEKFPQSESLTQLSLEMYHDPEIEDTHPILYIRQDKYDENIFKMIDDIFTEYQEEFSKINGWLLITTDFKPLT
jgi:hypothetical protein